ncbi:transcriptional regulator Myc-A-like isoform X1 [Penaeus chinensis]|uniref:transcriptional regulator Myc-A-like isoform X1 n=1 Tax=Penaeus chinensis TaxID=139456 RepID=UPI001FB5BE5D|nr:transcriptional regulator Myc-A-like isoform X1 [Penaeus chinensis]
MAMMATSPDLLSESWLSPTPMPHHALPEDIWSKFDIEHDRALALTNPEAMLEHHSMSGFSPVMGFTSTASASAAFHQDLATLPTPPHSPPTEHDLDDLVASIPEILESPSATPPSDISDILSDLEGMETAPLGAETSMDWSAAGCPSWWTPTLAPVPEESVKRDIMWGGGACCSSLLEAAPRKDRQVSECSADAALRDALRPDEISEDDEEDSEDNLPDTPSGTDSDCDIDESMSETSSPSGSPRSTNSASRYNANSPFRSSSSSPSPSASSSSSIEHNEHNYCGRVPAPENHTMPGILTPSDTEDEVDVVSCNDQAEAASPLSASPSATSASRSPSPRCQAPSKRSVDVKRQLQMAIQEAMRNRQCRSAGATYVEGEEAATATAATATTGSRFVSVKIKTQGKPAAYTKRMRDYHSEVMKTTKHRRRNRVESDEGRRSVHNSLERQRRVDLRNAFEYLRLLVPETKILEKAPKVQILKKAAVYCKQLQHTEERLLREKEKLKKQMQFLQQRKAAHSS